MNDRYNGLTSEQLIKECMLLEEQNKNMRMRLVAVKTIVNNIDPICAEKLRKALGSCDTCEGD